MFQTKEEIEKYFSTDKIECLICGKEYFTLGTHLLMKHNITVDEYKIEFGLPWGKGLSGKIAREKSSNHAKDLIKRGVVKLDHSEECMKRLHTKFSKQRPHCPANRDECVRKGKPSLYKINKKASEKKMMRLKEEEKERIEVKKKKDKRDALIVELKTTTNLSISQIVKKTGFSRKVIKTVLKNKGISKTNKQTKKRNGTNN